VYVLLGPRFEGNLPRIYIGEGDPVKPRLENHFANKDFWTSLILFTSKDENMNKAHVQYLESRLAKLATEAKRSVLDNGNSPQLPSLSEADTAEMEGFLEEMLLIYPVLGVTAFDKPQAEPVGSHRLYLKSKGIVASGFEAEQGFVVLANSQAVSTPVPSIHQYMKDLREALVGQGILVPQQDYLLFSQDYVFDSPSTAAGVVLGRSANGRIEWKDAAGRTLKELQQASVGGQLAV
jgi:hypothetical protein